MPITDLDGHVKETEWRIRRLERSLRSNTGWVFGLPNPNIVINGTARTNQRAYVSGTYVAPGTYTVDRWKANGTVLRNLILNPSIEAAITGWIQVDAGVASGSTFTRMTDGGMFGTCRARNAWIASRTHTSGTQLFGTSTSLAELPVVVAGTVYTASIYVRASKALSIKPAIPWRNAGGSNFANEIGAEVALAANTWTRISVTATAPATAVAAGIRLVAPAAGLSMVNGDWIDLDAAMVTEGSTLHGYFDGATADTTHFDYAWVATANASASTKTALTAITFVAAPQGQTVTVSTEGIWTQVVDRANIQNAEHALSWPGTSLGRIYKVGTTAPAFAASPIVTTLDGTGDVIVEFNAGTVCVNDVGVKLEVGGVPTPFLLDPLGVEIVRCQRYFFRNSAVGTSVMLGLSTYYTTTQHYSVIAYPVTMRAAPTLTVSSQTLALTTFQTGSTFASSSVAFADTNEYSSRMQVVTAAKTLGSTAWVELNPGYYLQGDAEL